MDKKEGLELYHDTHNQDRELFIKQYHHFREIMCSTKYDLEQKQQAFQDLAQAYLRCKLNPSDITLFKAVSMEFEMRARYEENSP